MFLFRKPTPQAIDHFRGSQSTLEFTYSAIGATRADPPNGYVVDHTRGKIGTGKTAFLRAGEALRHWKQLDLGWISSSPPLAPIEVGQTVSVLARVCGLWSLNACRIVYVTQQENPWPCFGYAYGTLPDHAESGEERFLVEWTPVDDVVYYDILAFSRPQSALTRLGFPLARRFQKRFARDSLQAMRRAVTRSTC